MKNRIKYLLLIALFALLLVGAGVLYNKLSDQVGASQIGTQSAQESSLAPDFTVYDAQGNAVKLSDFRGKPVVVNFWASWCGPCKSEMPDFQKAYETYGEDIVFMMVNMTDGSGETVESASAFIDKNGYDFPVYFDTASSAAITYGVSSIPATYFIGSDGSGIAYGVGAMDAQTLEKGISMLTNP